MTLYSKRSGFDLAPNAVARALVVNPPRWDLTMSNPTRAALGFDDAALEAALWSADPARYEPDPRGHQVAREALAQALSTDAERLVLTASTSEAYSYLIKLFCDPGGRVLVPEPSYPLLSMIAQYEGVIAAPYPLRYDGSWHVDRHALRRSFDSRAKLILTVSPNNPTGAFLSEGDRDALLALGAPVVCDEVFAPYVLRRDVPAPLEHKRVDHGLLFALGGLSKAAGLPQLKLSWIEASGESQLVDAALARLELIADTYLSVATPVQHALAGLLAVSEGRRRLIFERVKENHALVARTLAQVPELTSLPVDGGWYQVVRLPNILSEEAWVLGLLENGVLVQPGWFYDFSDAPWVVLSLLTPPRLLAQGLERMVETVADALG